jgi:hypothetical protein
MVKREVQKGGKEKESESETDADVARLVSIPLSDLVDLCEAILIVERKGKINEVPETLQQSLYSLLKIKVAPGIHRHKFYFSLYACATSALGKLDEVRDKVISECTRRKLDLDTILAEGRNPQNQSATVEAQPEISQLTGYDFAEAVNVNGQRQRFWISIVY